MIILIRAIGYAAAIAGGTAGLLGALGRVPSRPMGITLAVCACLLVLCTLARRGFERGRT